jgi:hypothetical protein
MSSSISQEQSESAPRQMYISVSGASYLASSPRDPSDSLLPHTISLTGPEIAIHVSDSSLLSLEHVTSIHAAEAYIQQDVGQRVEKATLLRQAIEQQSGPSLEEVEADRETEINSLEPVLVEINQSIAASAVDERTKRDAAQAKEKQAILNEQNDASRRQEALDAEEKTEESIGMLFPDKLQELKDKINEKRN